MGTYAQGIYCKRPQDNTFVPYTGFSSEQNLPADLVVQAIKTDTQGRIWIGTLSKGLFILNPKDSTVRQLKPEEGNAASLSYKDVLCIQHDKLGGTWVGTDGGGASLYDKRLNMFSLLSKNTLQKKIPIEQVRSITTDDKGGLWIGTSSSGLSYATNIQSRQLDRVNLSAAHITDSSERIVALHADADDTWIGIQDNGLLIMNSQTKVTKANFTPKAKGKYYLPDHTVWSILPVNHNRAWLGTRNAGLCLLDKQQGLIRNFQYNPLDKQGIADNNIRTIIAINDTLLCLGFENKGIQFFNTRSEKFSFLSQDKPLQQLREEEPTLKCLFFRPPYLLIGTLGNGIIVFDTTSGKSIPITEENGLPNNTIYSIVPDKLGNLWMSTNGGIIRFIPH
ncbi:ligand-binding sensor domain-containing protein [Paraflavitalea speifideaquila]|uniref:ligand-binding sensor domain-containing protein n=1 Tax=Paraflavitalea speifideaquila TaxID=3076558 RepID=UPI0028E687E9|nr:two-component regulator propeller domain-containing protein [Paraflavitalea speifideiaquila]